MNASFEEKSTWIQLVGTTLVLGGYFVVAGRMLAAGVRELPAFVPLFVVAVVVLVALLVAGHVVAAVTGRTDSGDERDRLIGWRAEARSSWLLGVGVLAAITALVLDVDRVWVAHLLLLALFLSELLRFVLQVVSYRRGF